MYPLVRHIAVGRAEDGMDGSRTDNSSFTGFPNVGLHEPYVWCSNKIDSYVYVRLTIIKKGFVCGVAVTKSNHEVTAHMFSVDFNQWSYLIYVSNLTFPFPFQLKVFVLSAVEFSLGADPGKGTGGAHRSNVVHLFQ